MFGKRLNYARKSRGLTAQQMANLLNIGLNSYRKYESSHRQPTFETLVKLADELDVFTDYLLGRDDFLESRGVPFGG